MIQKLFTLILIALFTNINAQEIPNLTFTQTFNYPENDPQDGSPGSILDPASMAWSNYSQMYYITYVAVTSANSIYIESGEAILFSIFVPPYVTNLNIGFNGVIVATQYCRVALLP